MALVQSFSGIRGIYKDELSYDLALRYAYAYEEYLKERYVNIRIVIGKDTRESGGHLRAAIIESTSSEIIDVGTLSTPAIQNSVRQYLADGGIIITASHNEPEYNGFKFLASDGSCLPDNDMKKIIARYKELSQLTDQEFYTKYLLLNKRSLPIKNVLIVEKDATEKYISFLKGFLSQKELSALKKANPKFVIDPNGGTGYLAKTLFDSIGLNPLYVNNTKGKFNHVIEPKTDALLIHKELAKKNNCDFIAGFDCDADRLNLACLDKSPITGNEILALIVDNILKKSKNISKETVIVNDATSYVVRDIAKKHKASYREVEVGEANVIDSMILSSSIVGGEGSNGGVIVPPSRCRDGILTLLLLLHISAAEKKSISTLVANLPKYAYLTAKVKVKLPFSKIRSKFHKHFLSRKFRIQMTGDESGGIKAIDRDDSWVWLRQSKTEDKLLRIASNSKIPESAKRLLNDAHKLLS